MSDTLNKSCPNCKVTIERINKWIDHVGCSPKKHQRYDRLLSLVKTLAKERPENDPFFKYVTESARDLLKEIGEL